MRISTTKIVCILLTGKGAFEIVFYKRKSNVKVTMSFCMVDKKTHDDIKALYI